MIKDLYDTQGNLLGTAIFHKRNGTVSVVYMEDNTNSNVVLGFGEFDQYKVDMELLYEDELPGSQINLSDLI